MIAYDVYALHAWFPSLVTAQLLTLLSHSLRWVAYGFLFGYFYPSLPGHRPLQKAGALVAALALPESLLVRFPTTEETAHPWLAILLRLGELVVFAMVLALYWEQRLVVVALLPWSAIRSFRRLATLSAPATALLLAVATTIATLLAGAGTAALLHTPDPDTTSSQSTPP
ncbi:hypothetical protein ACWDR2_34815 [Streptomyces sp. NPDC003631]